MHKADLLTKTQPEKYAEHFQAKGITSMLFSPGDANKPVWKQNQEEEALGIAPEVFDEDFSEDNVQVIEDPTKILKAKELEQVFMEQTSNFKYNSFKIANYKMI